MVLSVLVSLACQRVGPRLPEGGPTGLSPPRADTATKPVRLRRQALLFFVSPGCQLVLSGSLPGMPAGGSMSSGRPSRPVYSIAVGQAPALDTKAVLDIRPQGPATGLGLPDTKVLFYVMNGIAGPGPWVLSVSFLLACPCGPLLGPFFDSGGGLSGCAPPSAGKQHGPVTLGDRPCCACLRWCRSVLSAPVAGMPAEGSDP